MGGAMVSAPLSPKPPPISRSRSRSASGRSSSSCLPTPVARHPPDAPAPANALELVKALHQGAIFALPPSQASLELTAHAGELVRSCLASHLPGGGDYSWEKLRYAPEPFGHLTDARRRLSLAPQRLLADVCRSLGLSEATRVDAPRLRSISAGSEHS